MSERFAALVAYEPGAPARAVDITLGDIDTGEVTIEVGWSSLNYKDALAVTGRAPIARRFPVVCGIDLAGRVVDSSSDAVQVGDEVIVTGCGLGETHDGGYARYARVPASYCVALPEGLDQQHAMGLGTAGLTAMLAVQALAAGGCSAAETGGLPVLVTGAAGGVGSIAIALLTGLGYSVVASSGRRKEWDYLEHLGAVQVVAREEFSGSAPSLGKERFAAAIDVVGGNTLANVLSVTRAHGVIASCGHVGGAQLSTTVFPFILRGVSLVGINSVWPPPEKRVAAWYQITALLSVGLLDEVMTSEPFERVPDLAAQVLAGHVRGRIAIAIGKQAQRD